MNESEQLLEQVTDRLRGCAAGRHEHLPAQPGSGGGGATPGRPLARPRAAPPGVNAARVTTGGEECVAQAGTRRRTPRPR
ncbi:hypothetical protein ACWGHM_24030 [Streptomyces sp. NPDC054904]